MTASWKRSWEHGKDFLRANQPDSLLVALKPVSARAAVVGSALAIGMFATTSSFLLSTPGAFEPSLGGFPALSVLPGQFLIKDLVLLAVSVWMLGDALRHCAHRAAE